MEIIKRFLEIEYEPARYELTGCVDDDDYSDFHILIERNGNSFTISPIGDNPAFNEIKTYFNKLLIDHVITYDGIYHWDGTERYGGDLLPYLCSEEHEVMENLAEEIDFETSCPQKIFDAFYEKIMKLYGEEFPIA